MLRYTVLIVLVGLSRTEGATKRESGDYYDVGHFDNSLKSTKPAFNGLSVCRGQETTQISYLCLPFLVKQRNGLAKSSTSTSIPLSRPEDIGDELTKPKSAEEYRQPLNSKAHSQGYTKDVSELMNQDEQTRPPINIPSRIVHQFVSERFADKMPSLKTNRDTVRPLIGNPHMDVEPASSESSEDERPPLNSKAHSQGHPKFVSELMNQNGKARTPMYVPHQIVYQLVPGGFTLPSPLPQSNLDIIRPYTKNRHIDVETMSSELSEDVRLQLNPEGYNPEHTPLTSEIKSYNEPTTTLETSGAFADSLRPKTKQLPPSTLFDYSDYIDPDINKLNPPTDGRNIFLRKLQPIF